MGLPLLKMPQVRKTCSSFLFYVTDAEPAASSCIYRISFDSPYVCKSSESDLNLLLHYAIFIALNIKYSPFEPSLNWTLATKDYFGTILPNNIIQ